MPPFDDVDIESLLKASEWTDAHDCFRTKHLKNRPYEDLYEVLPLWLYARTCLEEEEQEIKASTSRNSGHQTDPSSVPPVNRLPSTVLARIFEHLRDQSQVLHPLDSDSSRHSGPSRYNPNPYSWLPTTTLVSRHWRNTAYTHPCLWTVIDLLSYSREVVRSLLILSDKELLSVYLDTSDLSLRDKKGFGVKELGELEIKIDLVLDEHTRIEKLELNLSTAKFLKLVPWKQFASSPWTRLTALILCGPTADGDVDLKPENRMHILPPFPEKNFPRLQELVSDSLYPKWDGPCLPALRRLELRNASISTQEYLAYAPRDFLDFLARSPQLQSLKIDGLDINMRD